MSQNEKIQAMVAPFVGVVSSEKIAAGVRFLSAVNEVYTNQEPVAITVGDEFVKRLNNLTPEEKDKFFQKFKGQENMTTATKKTFTEQCAELHGCLPVNPIKDALTELHNQMICQITELEAQLADSQKDSWIPVSERLPNHEESILVAKNNKVMEAFFYEGKFISCDEDYDDEFHDAITHWMPLPKPPAMQKETT